MHLSPSPQLKTRIPTTPFVLVKIIIGAILLVPSITHANIIDPRADTLIRFLKNEPTPSRPLLPESLTITEIFHPSTQPFAGTITSLQGTAYVYHKNGDTAYRIKKDHPVFNGDTLVTGENTRVRLHLADDSTLILTAHSKLLIEKSLPRVKVRDTSLRLFFGKIRSLVKGIIGEYTVTTPTSSIGVRGTDFAVAVAPAPKSSLPGKKETILPIGFMTAVLTGDHQSTVEVAGSFGPSVMIKPLSIAGVRTGRKAEQPVYIGPAALSLLEEIAGQPEKTQERPALPKPILPKLSQNIGKQPAIPKKSVTKSAPTTRPCWPLDSIPEGVQHFRVCGPAQKAPVTTPVKFKFHFNFKQKRDQGTGN
ncbi:MAG: hypothetical protein D3916_08010 [Candidatus Electrothrix sp. MAN1_4]|nr:hypothetical protein [Candidatus Electrothrix sp. MAN1_4]